MILFAFLPAMWAALAVGVGAISIPVIIHLINRRRYKIVPWAAMKFLLAAQKQTRKRMRIEQLLLLFVRMMILALVLLAMVAVMDWAEGTWSNLGITKLGWDKGKRKFRTHHIFVLDASLSMNQKVGKQTAFEVARQQMLKRIDDNQSGDGYSVLILKDNPTWLVGEASHNTRKIKTAIEDVKPSHGNASLPAAMNMIVSKLNEAKQRFPGGAQAVYFFTDLQQSTWTGAVAPEAKTEAEKEKPAFLQMKELASTIFVDCGPEKTANNLAVSRVEFDVSAKPWIAAGDDLTLFATVKNYGTEPKKVRPELLWGKAKASPNDAALQMRVNATAPEEIIPPTGGERRFVFEEKVKFPTAGTYAIQVKLDSDGLDQDNARTIIVTVRETIPILLVNGKPAAPQFEKATDYLKLALNPFATGAEEKWLPLRPEVVSPARFAEMSEADLEKYDCIYWCDVDLLGFGPEVVRKVDTHVRRGGGFVVTLGDKASEQLHRYNELLATERQLLPARLMKRYKAPVDHHFYLEADDPSAFEADPLSAFANDADQTTLRRVRFSHFVQADPVPGKARTVLNFRTERLETAKPSTEVIPSSAPAIIEWHPPLSAAQMPAPPALKHGQRVERQPGRYRGRVILMTSSVSMDWSNWPANPSFGAMMHELTRYAVAGRLREQSQTVGNLLEAYLPAGKETEITVQYPAELEVKPATVKTQLIDDVNLARFADTDVSGIYRFESGGHEIPFAVNVPVSTQDFKGSESDLTRMEEAALKALYPGWDPQFVKDARLAMLSGAPVNNPDAQIELPAGPDIANVALLIVLGLLFLEIILAWHFGHYTTTEGAVTGAPAGPASTWIAAAIAILSTIVFAIGTLIIAHEIWTGDFLGFLPDMLRTWAEKAVGAENLQAGEGSRWHYEKQNWLFGLPGKETWYAVFFTIAALVTIFLTYKAEAPRVSKFFKFLLGALRVYLILFTVWFLLPRPELHYDREAFPDIVLLIDDTRSMGETDTFQDAKVKERVLTLGKTVKDKLIEEIPTRLTALESEIAAKRPAAENDAEAKHALDGLLQRKAYWEKQRDIINTDKWRPSRLQLVQAILAQPEPHWLKTLLGSKRAKVHVFHLDSHGRAKRLGDAQGDAGDLIDVHDSKTIERTIDAIKRLDPVGDDSRLGVAVKQVIDHYNGANLTSVIMFTDGVTTRDEPLSEAGKYAAAKGVALFFVGVGDANEGKYLRIFDLECEDQIYKGDRAVFELRVDSKGLKDMVLPVRLKLIDPKTGKEIEVDLANVRLDPEKAVRVRVTHTPPEVGRYRYRIEIDPPKLEANEKPFPQENLRIERTIEVIDTKQIKVLFVEAQPRYEFRYIKFLLEREGGDEKDPKQKKKSIDFKVLLLDADDGWAGDIDKTGVPHFPPTLADLNQYDVLIIGDCDPKHKKLVNHLKDIRAFVFGETEDGKKASKPGGGILFIAGAFNNPHRYQNTPLADVLPVEPLQPHPPTEVARPDKLRPLLTPMGRMHPIFRFSLNEGDSMRIWDDLEPMYWNSSGYQIKPAAEVLVVHPQMDAAGRADKQNPKHPLVVQQHSGTGRSMFFGFDETWRWRKREHESKFNTFWIQTMRYLSKGRSNKTDLRLDRQMPYKVGEKITVTVRFPESGPGGGPLPKIGDKADVKVTVEYHPPGAKPGETPPPVPISLAKRTDSWGTYEGIWERTREGKYTFRLTTPDVSANQPDGQKPSAEAVVELPPGELQQLRMDAREMMYAADKTQGAFFTLDRAEDVFERLPPGTRVVIATNAPPTLLWNQWWVFALVVLLITSEWVLRKMKHLL